MRKRKLNVRDYRSVIELQPCNLTKDVLKSVAQGKITELVNHSQNGAYDFDGEDVDFDKELLQDCPNKIDQHLYYRELFGKHKLSKQSDQQTITELQSEIEALKAKLAEGSQEQ